MCPSNMPLTYNLTPMQKGMLFNCLASPRSGTDVEQVIGTLHESLDLAAFRKAWQRLVDRHEALRMRFLLDGNGNARQFPLDQKALSIDEHDWQNQSSRENEQLLENYLKDDRARGFDPRVDMPIRVAVFRLGESHYRFVFTWWHGILDGRARLILVRELFHFYEAFRYGEDLNIPLPRRYTDYTEWMVAHDMADAAPYWKNLLDGFTEPTPVGIHRLNAGEGGGFGNREIRLSQALTSQLQAAATTYGVTVNTLVQGAWALVLGQYSGEADVVFGTIRACRHSPFNGDGFGKEIVGCLINTVPVRVKIPAEVRVLDWLKDLRAQHVAVRPYENSPLGAIQSCSNVPADQRLFNSIVVYENHLLDSALRAQGSEVATRRFETRGQAGYPITVYGNYDTELLLGISNDRGYLDDLTAERMLAYLIKAIQCLAERPDDVIADLPLLPEEERQLMLDEWNRTGSPFPEESSIQSCFEEQVARTPEAPALTCYSTTWTYLELDRKAEGIARQLRKAGARPETVVGICMERCLDLVAGMLGILKTGAAYLPLDPTYPRDRLEFMIEDARPLLVLSNQKTRERLPMTDAAVFSVDDDNGFNVTNVFSGHEAESAGGHHLAYVIYTSGSTGKPKGVMVEHRNVMNLFTGIDAILGSEPGVFLAVISVSFDPSVTDLFWTLSRGYHVILWPGIEESKDMSIPELIRTHGVTHLEAVPSFIQMVMKLPGGPEALASLRQIQIGGETLSPKLLRDAGPLISRRIVNAYGPTETTVQSTAWKVDPGAPSISIGRPIANTQIFILDRFRRPVPLGVVGELYIGGAGVARGYLNRPELTAEKFVTNPFDRKAGGRLYRTGDLVRYRPDGMLEFIGRIDDQVKIRGFRMELGEIEAVLNKHPDLMAAVVDVQPTTEGGKRLVAYVVPGPQGMPATRAIREWVGRELPVFMVPAAFVALEKIPRTSNGKLDRSALPPPTESGIPQDEEERTPTPLEANLTEIWCQVLHRKQVGLDENFFDLGGDSLMAVAMIVAIEERFGVKLPVKDVFEAPTISSLATVIQGYEEADEIAPITAARRVTTTTASFAQEALWVHTQLDPDSAVYNVPVGLRLRGAINLAALQAALDSLVERHEALRTTFAIVDGRVCQVIANLASIPLQRVTVQDAPENDRLRRAEELASEETRRPFDLAHGPLIRATLVTLGPTDHLLVLVLHHIICDGKSIMILLRELGTFYSSGLTGKPASLSPLPIQYADFALWQREHLTASRLAPHLDFWKQQLTGAPPLLNLPTDRPRPAAQSYRGAQIPIYFEREFVERLRVVSRRCGCTLFMTLMAGLITLLGRYLGREERDVVVGLPVAGRTNRETEEIVGFFVNTLVLRLDLSNEPTFRELLSRVRDTSVAAYAHQELPFEHLVAALNPERSLSHAPVFQVVLALHEDFAKVSMTGLDEVSLVPLHSGTAKFDLSLALDSNSEGGLTGFLEYATDLFDQRTVERMVGHFQQLLGAAAQEPDQKVDQISLLSQFEQHQLLVEWNDTGMSFPEESSIQGCFEEQVARTPDAPALTCASKTWTFRELDRRAEGIARELKRAGARPETVVGICMERSLDLVAGMLGILKTGAAYLPLDHTYPAERLLFMIEDARPLLVVSNRIAGKKLTATDTPVLSVDDDSAFGDADIFSEHKGEKACGHHLAYVIYTSGSTGKPKGVMVEHRNVMNLFAGADAVLGSEPGVTLAVTSVSFDPSVVDLFWALSRGHHVVIWPGMEGTSGMSIPELIRTYGVTHIGTVPSFIRMVTMQPGGLDALASLRRIQVGGEPLSPLLLRDLGPSISRRIVNAYGPTETTVLSTAWQVDPEARSIPIGRPIANTLIFVLDRNRRPVPVGVVGELYIGGAGVARGYLNRPEFTAEKFVANPFDNNAGGRLYRTGDLVRYRPNGMLEFVGRIDDQVKIRGFRVEPGEVEAVLCRHPDIREAVVDFQEAEDDRKRLVAYCVPGPKRVPLRELREWVGRELPAYMVPAAFVVLDEIPRTPNGKMDRRALPPPIEDGSPSGEVERIPTPLEAQLIEVWREVLGVRDVGPDKNFFDLGGDSLLGVALAVAVERRFGVKFPLEVLYKASTVAQLADWIEAGRPGAVEGPPPALETSICSERSEAQTATERWMLALWERLLDVSPISVRDNFFDLNDDKTLFDEMLAQIRNKFGVFAEGLPVTAIAGHPTIEAIARIIDDTIRPTPSLIICLQPHGAKLPLFLIHAGGGYVFFYRALAARLGPDRPVYAIRAETSSDGMGRPFHQSKSVEEVASRYIAEIRTVRPKGPYCLGGACVGGIIAFEMARQLQAQGEELAGPILLFDSIVFNNPHLTREKETSILDRAGIWRNDPLRDRFTRHLTRTSQQGLVKGLWYMSRIILRNAPSVTAMATRAAVRKLCAFPLDLGGILSSKATKTEGASNTAEQMQRHLTEEFLMTSSRLQSNYVPSVFDGSMVLFSAIEGCHPEPLWTGLARGGLTVHRMPGTHLDMMEEPAAIKTAALVGKHLDQDKKHNKAFADQRPIPPMKERPTGYSDELLLTSGKN